MEAWKFVDYSSLSPVFALSLTTERWGLEPFPGNLVAIRDYWKHIQTSNKTVQAFTLPYTCSDRPSDFSVDTDLDLINSGAYSYNISTNISASADICTEHQSCCEDSHCLVLIEGIGKTTTGPANSNIVGLTHGISFLLVITTIIAFIMGCWLSKFEDTPPPPATRVSRNAFKERHNPPPRPQNEGKERYAEQAATSANTAKEIARCSDLLRQMYKLDLQIWGMENCVAQEIPAREDMKRRANALLAEVSRIVHNWKSTSSSAKWSDEERQHIKEICGVMDQQEREGKRYEIPARSLV